MYKKSPKGAVSWTIMALSFVCVVFFDIHVIPVLIGCAIVGLVASFTGRREDKKNAD